MRQEPIQKNVAEETVYRFATQDREQRKLNQSYYQFLAAHGRCWEVTKEHRRLLHPGELRRCFLQAMESANESHLNYVEGVVVEINQPSGPIVHAWTANNQGIVVDPIFGENSKNYAYFGIAIRQQIVERIITRTHGCSDAVLPVIAEDEASFQNWRIH